MKSLNQQIVCAEHMQLSLTDPRRWPGEGFFVVVPCNDLLLFSNVYQVHMQHSPPLVILLCYYFNYDIRIVTVGHYALHHHMISGLLGLLLVCPREVISRGGHSQKLASLD